MRKFLFLSVMLFIGLNCGAANGRRYYVANNGNDNNAGTLEAPYATIQKAFNEVTAGDTIIIRGGTYTTASHQYANQFMQNKSGTAEAPITIKAYEGETPILDGTNCPSGDPSMAVILMSNVKYIIIDGLTVQNGTRTGIHFVGQCENITVKNCTVKDCTAPGIGFGGDVESAQLCKNVMVTGNTVINCAQTSREAISLRWVENFEISHNIVKDVTKESIDAKSGCVNGRIFNNYVENAGHVGIYVDAGFRNTQVMHDIYVYDNIINGVTGTGITVAAEEGNEGHSIYVYNNLVYNSESASGGGIKVAMNSDNNDNGNLHDVYLCNNTVYNMAQQGFYVNLPYVQNIVFRNNLSVKCNANQFAIRDDVPASEVIFDNNMYLGNQSYTLNSSNLNGDNGYYSWEAALSAFFVDYANGDFRLAENAPAIDAGTDTGAGTGQGAPTTDLDGKLRPLGNGYDIGCYEYGNCISLEVAGYGGNPENGNWVFIASPMAEDTNPESVAGMIASNGNYDLYRFNQSATLEWENYKQEGDHYHFELENGKGYLYACKEDTKLYFTGTFYESDTKTVELEYDGNAILKGWNLVGNPFPVAAYANKSYYTMNEDGTGIEPNTVSSATAIPACTGIMVKAIGENETITFSKTSPSATTNNGALQIAVSQDVELVETPTHDGGSPATLRQAQGSILDKAIVSFNDGDQLPKFHFGDSNAKLFITQNGTDYAIAYVCRDGVHTVSTTDVPVNFKATKNGTYTLNVNMENMDLDYLHLIDNLTGANIDLLATSTGSVATYTFTSKTTDYDSRFKLLFSPNAASTGSTADEAFAYIDASGNIIITADAFDAADARSASLQVIDMMGRVVVSCGGHTRCVPTAGIPAGVYVLRLIDGDNIRTQKTLIE